MKLRPITVCAMLLVSLHIIGPSMAVASSEVSAGGKPDQQSMEKKMAQHPYVGMWVTDGGHIRHELLPNGRYDEARGTRNSAYQGRYWDDTGFTADGTFVDAQTLHHGGMIFRRQ
jgi:hypothetical protein